MPSSLAATLTGSSEFASSAALTNLRISLTARGYGGDGFMRADDHQFFQPMYIANLGPIGKDQPFDEENTGWGWKMMGKIDTPDTNVSTTCKMNRPS